MKEHGLLERTKNPVFLNVNSFWWPMGLCSNWCLREADSSKIKPQGGEGGFTDKKMSRTDRNSVVSICTQMHHKREKVKGNTSDFVKWKKA